ncbi:MAG: dolichol kinase [Halobacteria archaeon]|nr:dolichol kinase [Halobacteria archaeon]
MISEHVERRLFHALGSLIPITYILGVVEWKYIVILTWIGLGLAAVLEFVRLFLGYKFLSSLYRDYESENIAGYAIGTAGIFVAVNLFGVLGEDPMIASVSILMLTIADPVVGVMGTGELRHIKPPRILATMFLLSFLIGVIFLPPSTSAAGALGATVADGAKLRIKSYVIDDNLTIPIYSGVLMTVIKVLLR